MLNSGLLIKCFDFTELSKSYYENLKLFGYNLNFWKVFSIEQFGLILNKLFDGFERKLQTSKWAKITKASTDTALRDIKDLVEKGILQQADEGGRNANYKLADFK